MGNGKYTKKTLKEIRVMMIQCLLDALSESATLSNSQSGFRASGIYPLNGDIPLSSKYAMNDSLRTQYPDLYKKIKGDNLINNRHLNGSSENLSFVYQAEFHAIMKDEDLNISIERMKQKIRLLFQQSGKNTSSILTRIPDIFEEKNGMITRVRFDQ